MKRFFTILLFLCSFTTFGQLELAVQKGHSDEVVQLEFSKNNKYLASLAKNNEIIIWDIALEKSIANIKLGTIEIIEGVKFTDDEQTLKIKTFRTTFFYNIFESKLNESGTDVDTLYRIKDYYYNPETGFEVFIKKGAIIKKVKSKLFRRYKRSVSYTNANFVAFDISLKHNKLIGVAEKNLIFVYHYLTGIKLREFKAHNSKINDVRFSPDGKYFATSGKDRSIIIWNTENLKQEKRLYSNIYQKKTVTFNHDGTKIYIGDELGNLFQINLTGNFPSIQSKMYIHAINKIIPHSHNQITDYFVVTDNNYVYQKPNVFSRTTTYKYPFVKLSQITHTKEFLMQNVAKAYQNPFGQIRSFDISPNHNFIAYTGICENPHVIIHEVSTKKSHTLRIPYDLRQYTDVDFVSDNEVITTFDSSKVIYQWKVEAKDVYLKTDTLPFMINNFNVIGQDKIWLNSKFYGQFIYDLKTRHLEQTLKQAAEEVFIRNQMAFIATTSNSILVYDIQNKQIYHRFMSHKGKITNLNVHPNQDLFVSSSHDGSIKLWSLNQKRLLTTIFPFKNNEFIFINPSNYYLATKGALEEIGFRYKGNYFLAEQFDIKYNRPDIILAELGYQDSLLINAYHKAYKKRLRKLDFSEDQLDIDFALPEITITNLNELPKQTEADKIQIKLDIVDQKHKLDRINVWLNNVAIYGTKGISLKEFNSNEVSTFVDVDLLSGDNKIQINALNASGAESFKSTIHINCTKRIQKSNLYLVSIGVSKHKNQKYNLNYADKDAKDFAATFNKSNAFNEVNTLVMTNEEVTLAELTKIKPFLQQANTNDVVMIFVAGHGVLDDDFNYYFASYDMDFNKPKVRGIPYESIEKLLDGIKAIKKLLFIDTCHSGELDKEDVEETDQIDNSENGDIIFRAAGKNVSVKDNPLGLKSTNELMKSLFTELRTGTGATVISSSGGAELSIEGGEFENGLFTYCLLEGLVNKKADLDKDKSITISEIQKYVSKEVSILSKGLQTPTSRIENNQMDFRVW
ncbi:MAG: caspase family protein [Putridiphycobacter sp.]